MATHYETLGVPPEASPQEIRKAYLRRARALHPDRQLGRPPGDAMAAEQAMRQVNAAWTVLSDAKKRAEYDRRSRPQSRPPVARPAPVRVPRPAPSPEPDFGRAVDEQEGDGTVSVWASIPVLLIVGLLLGVLIITAFADREPADIRPVVEDTPSRLAVGDCFAFVGSDLRSRSCSSGTSDGVIVAVVPARGNCPAGPDPLSDPTSELFLCWARMLPGSTNTLPGG